MKVSFGDLPPDAQAMLTRHLRVDFSHCSFKAPKWFSAWACNDAGHIVGIFAVEFPVWFEGKITILILDPKCVTRRALRAIFTAAFAQAKRLTAEVEPDNVRSLRQVQRLGFHFEGHHPLGLEGCRDTIVFGMVKEECRWLTRNPFSTYPEPFAGRAALKQIFATGLPSDMRTANATRRSAGVGGIKALFKPVHEDANKTVNFTGCSVVPHLRVAPRIDGKRPDKALRTFVCEGFGQRSLRS